MLTIGLKALGIAAAGAVFALVAARIATKPTKRDTPENQFDISDIELVECRECGVSTFAGTERCPLCGAKL